jgi:type IX secretion system substrate protein
MRKLFYTVQKLNRFSKSFAAILILHFGLLLNSNIRAQVFNGDLTLHSQAEVDAFNYTSVTGILFINFGGNTISNLDHLSTLTSVGKSLFLTQVFITNLNGLSNLQSVGGTLSITGCFRLHNLDGLSSLISAHDVVISQNGSLQNIDGLSNLTTCTSVTFEEDDSIPNLNALANFTSFAGDVKISNNAMLTDVSGLSNLTHIGGDFLFGGNAVSNMDAFTNVTFVGGKLQVTDQDITNIDGLSNLAVVGNIFLGAGETNLDAFSNITDVHFLQLISNPNLKSTDGLLGITHVKGGLFVEGCGQLTDLHGLSNITTVDGRLWIKSNFNLPNLDDLSNLIAVGFDITIDDNHSLTDFCGLYNLFNTGTINGSIEILRNGANTVTFTPNDVTVNTDPGVCTAVIPDASIPDPINGCLVPITKSHTSFAAGNIYPGGTTDITWTATDAAGNTASGVQHIIVVDNQAPVILSSPSNLTVSCAADVPAADVGLVTATDNCSVTVTHVGDEITNQTCANRFTLTRTYRATDGAGNTATCSQVITVNDNTPPQINSLAPSQTILWPPNHTMRDITLNYTVTDNCTTNATTTVNISSNEPVNGTADGDTDPDWVVVDNHHIKLRAERAANGTGRIYTITVTTTDGCNAAVSASTQVEVVHNITGPQSGKPFIVGSTVNFSGEFWDKPTNKHTSKWLIDGSTSVKGIITEPTASKNGKATGSYKFTTAGVYKLQMNIIDQNNVTSYSNTNGDIEEIVVIYDPNGGYTYGGGWFESPAGALVSDPTATGKASYGFTVNYFKTSTYPKGETQFEFKIGSLEFNALNYDYLVINGARAQFKGTGKVTGDQSGYAFIMTVTDGNLDGTGVDKIRMKIFNKNTGQVIYDNQQNESDAANPTTAVADNSSVVVYSTSNLLTKAVTESEDFSINSKLQVTSFPNPSNRDFTITIHSDDQISPLTYQVVDVNGRIIEEGKNISSSVMKLGERYHSGVYIVSIIQNNNRRILKLVKTAE